MSDDSELESGTLRLSLISIAHSGMGRGAATAGVHGTNGPQPFWASGGGPAVAIRDFKSSSRVSCDENLIGEGEGDGAGEFASAVFPGRFAGGVFGLLDVPFWGPISFDLLVLVFGETAVSCSLLTGFRDGFGRWTGDLSAFFGAFVLSWPSSCVPFCVWLTLRKGNS